VRNITSQIVDTQTIIQSITVVTKQEEMGDGAWDGCGAAWVAGVKNTPKTEYNSIHNLQVTGEPNIYSS
jgi:hypothetical protein